eukprot:TRINITY_DN52066_c0_g1_i1.p1 TRINITY_DN52066_c0_g1~~TRINITY_DN52066_c0_g1_i1.p1  ORF type:complete len:233 (-),score=35.72 TRINITY_DN52066_c0_g1_i1:10-708(-)
MPASKGIKQTQFQLGSGVSRYSGASRFSRKGVWKIAKDKRVLKKVAKKAIEKVSKAQTKKFRGKEVKVLPNSEKGPAFYPSVDVKVPIWRGKKHQQNAARLRQTIVPGTVLILLTGKHRGTRVIFLKQLESGNLLVTGPYKFNGVPLKRVNQRYVIATSTKVDISGVKLSDKLTDDFFGTKKGEKVDSSRVQEQAQVDEQLKSVVSSTPFLADYLRNRFSLRRDQPPHTLKF